MCEESGSSDYWALTSAQHRHKAGTCHPSQRQNCPQTFSWLTHTQQKQFPPPCAWWRDHFNICSFSFLSKYLGSDDLFRIMFLLCSCIYLGYQVLCCIQNSQDELDNSFNYKLWVYILVTVTVALQYLISGGGDFTRLPVIMDKPCRLKKLFINATHICWTIVHLISIPSPHLRSRLISALSRSQGQGQVRFGQWRQFQYHSEHKHTLCLFHYWWLNKLFVWIP